MFVFMIFMMIIMILILKILGFVEVCIMHPLDLVKTRMQLQSKVATSGDLYYTGVGDCFKKMYRTEGFLSFWKGILPPILAETPKRAVKVGIRNFLLLL